MRRCGAESERSLLSTLVEAFFEHWSLLSSSYGYKWVPTLFAIFKAVLFQFKSTFYLSLSFFLRVVSLLFGSVCLVVMLFREYMFIFLLGFSSVLQTHKDNRVSSHFERILHTIYPYIHLYQMQKPISLLQ